MVAPSDKIFPLGVLIDYWNLQPDIPGSGKIRICVNSYKCRNPAFGGTVKEEMIKDAFLGASKWKIVAEAGGAKKYVDAFVGKGSPDTITTVLELVYKYKDDFLKSYGKSQTEPYKSCARILKADSSPEAMLQAFCDAFIGLDCNGFVGNFVQRANHALKLEASSSIKTGFYSARKAVRKSPEEIRDRDLVIWSNFLHIAAVDHVQTETGRVMVAQSTAGGPQANNHKPVAVNGGLFRFDPPATRFGGQVYILDVGLSEPAKQAVSP